MPHRQSHDSHGTGILADGCGYAGYPKDTRCEIRDGHKFHDAKRSNPGGVSALGLLRRGACHRPATSSRIRWLLAMMELACSATDRLWLRHHEPRHFRQDRAAGDLEWVHIAAIDQDRDADFAVRHQADIGGGVVEA